MASEEISVTFKLSGKSETFEFSLLPTDNVAQVLDKVVEARDELTRDTTTLVRKGRILKENQVVSEVGVQAGETLHLVVSKVRRIH